MEVKEAQRILEAQGLEAEMLDSVVHSVASKIASDVNNEGMKGQVRYLLDNGLTVDEIIAAAMED